MIRLRHWHRYRSFDRADVDYQQVYYFIPARRGHFLIPRSPRTITHIVIHITGGESMTESGAVNRFRNRTGSASAHYIVNREGDVIQMVREDHIANHLGGMHSRINRQSIGIEHVNRYDTSTRLRPTTIQYRESARLVAYLCFKYDIPVTHSLTRNTSGIIGHSEISPHTGHRNCPNGAWDWRFYIPLVAGYYRILTKDLYQRGVHSSGLGLA